MKASLSGDLFAGVGRSDITPAPNFPNGMWMAQKHLRGAGIHRRLLIQCVLIGVQDDAVALLNYDLCILSAKQVEEIRCAVHTRIGIPKQRIWLYVTHNHAAPVTQDFYDREGADEVQAYIRALPGHSADAAQQAWEGRCTARVASGSGTCNIGINRDLNYNGRMVTGPNPGGFADSEVGVIRFDDQAGRPIAAIVTYGCHPTYLGPTNKLISPDYPGVTRDVFESLTGTPCVFLQAGAGNVGPLRGFLGDIAEVERCGTILACEAAQTFLSIQTQKTRTRVAHVVESGAPLGMTEETPIDEVTASFRVISGHIMLPTNNNPTVYDTVESDMELAAAAVEKLRSSGAPVAEIQHALQQLLRHKLRTDRKNMYFSNSEYPIEVGAIKMGDFLFVSVGCEAYAEIGVAIKKQSPSPRTVFAAYQGADVIYVAPEASYNPPVSMEVFNSPFGPQAAELLIAQTGSILKELVAA
jgi:neutral/alkaline ceramidase-like enzyme